MAIGDKLFYASLFGTKIAEVIPRLQEFQASRAEVILPPIPFLKPFGEQTTISEVSSNYEFPEWEQHIPSVEEHFFPLKFRQRKELRPGEPAEQWYTFPWEPLVSISGKNIITKKSPANPVNFIGTVKEYWSQDDYEITITGTIFGKKMMGSAAETYPRVEFEKLRDYCSSPLGIEVQHEQLQMLGINHLVVEDFSFPFSSGENVQAYELKCYSDFTSELLLEIE